MLKNSCDSKNVNKNKNRNKNENKLFEILNAKHEGMGGLYFLVTNLICAVIMTMALQLSWDSQAIAMSDNLAYITSINSTVYSYIGNLDPFEATNPTITKKAGGSYKPLNDFNRMIKDAGISQTGASLCKVKWTGKKTYIQMGQIETSLGTKITPHRQESIIEEK